MKRALLVIAAVVLAGLLVPAQVSWACSCANVPVADLVKAADVVFVGQVATIDSPAQGDSTAHFNVGSIYKGSVEQTTAVRTAREGDTCRADLVAGTSYAVFATIAGGGLRTGLCAGTTKDVGVLARAGIVSIRAFASTAPAPPAGSALDPRTLGEIENPGRAGPIAAAGMLFGAAVLAYALSRRGTLRRTSRDSRGPV
jgi:hypothetical protein